jgi:hypothetical protein
VRRPGKQVAFKATAATKVPAKKAASKKAAPKPATGRKAGATTPAGAARRG